MKLKAYAALCAAGMLTLTACTAEDPILTPNADGNVTFTIKAPGSLGSRADLANFGTGTTATELEFYVYELDKDGKVIKMITSDKDNYKMSNLETRVTMNLVNGKSYGIVWFAQAKNHPYTYDKDNHTITVNYKDMSHNREFRDAFYEYTTIMNVSGAIEETVTLNRPFAQINFGTSDFCTEEDNKVNYDILVNAFGDANFSTLKTQLVTADVPNVLNLMTGEVSGSKKVECQATARPVDYKFPYQPKDKDGKEVQTYDHLGMNYVLAPKSALLDLEFNIYNGTELYSTVEVASAPIKANYRTNIFGQLLTSSADFKVVIDPIFVNDKEEAPEHNIEVKVVKAENFGTTAFDKETAYVVAGSAEEPATVKMTSDMDIEVASIVFSNVTVEANHNLTITSEEVNFTDATIDASYPVTIKSAEVTFSGVEITGVKAANASSNPSVVINEAEAITISDVTFNREGSYNGFEIGLNSTTYPAEIVVEDLDWSNAKHNAVCVYGMEDNAVITVRNCKFDNSLGGVPVRLANKNYAKNVTVNLVNVERTGVTASAGRCDDVVVWIQDANSYANAKKENKLDAGNYFETMNPFGTFTINFDGVKLNGEAVTASTPVFTDKYENNSGKLVGVAVNNIGKDVVNNDKWVVSEHAIGSTNAILIKGWGMDLVLDSTLLPTVNVK